MQGQTLRSHAQNGNNIASYIILCLCFFYVSPFSSLFHWLDQNPQLYYLCVIMLHVIKIIGSFFAIISVVLAKPLPGNCCSTSTEPRSDCCDLIDDNSPVDIAAPRPDRPIQSARKHTS